MSYIKAVIADKNRKVYDLPGFAACGMSGNRVFPLKKEDTIDLPYSSELFFLPHRKPVVYDIRRKKIIVLENNPYREKEPCFAIAAFTSPGYTQTLTCAYREKGTESPLPLFSYTALGWQGGIFRAAAVRVDRERRQDLRLMDKSKISRNVERFNRLMPKNRLVKHLSKCALVYNCPAGKNFFLQRYECPLPTSPACNASCLGCLSLQESDCIPATQPRIRFTPAPEEIAEVALFHIKNVKKPIVSFGQGCEGEPLMVSRVIEEAIKLIRKKTAKGTINLNTNASIPAAIERLVASGLDSMRVSMNSVQEAFYERYFRPKGYGLKDVVRAVNIAKKYGRFVSINYFVLPGFTDRKSEFKALKDFIAKNRIDMIQWRNLNYDPNRYFEEIGVKKDEETIGMARFMEKIRKKFPKIKFGYFNPPKEKFRIIT